MTPAELNQWAATDVMGWHLHIQGLHWPDVWVESEEFKALIMNCSAWQPATDHNQCQQVIEKAIEKGVIPRSIIGHMEVARGSEALWTFDLEKLLLATAEQKLRAVHAAWQGERMNKDKTIKGTCFMYHDDLPKAEDGRPLSVFWTEEFSGVEYVHVSVLKEAIALCNLKAEVIPMDGGDLDGGGRCCVTAEGIMSDVGIHNLWAWLRWDQGDWQEKE